MIAHATAAKRSTDGDGATRVACLENAKSIAVQKNLALAEFPLAWGVEWPHMTLAVRPPALKVKGHIPKPQR